MNSILLLTLCCVGMVVAQEGLFRAMAMKRLFDQPSQPGMSQNAIAPKGMGATSPVAPGNQMFGGMGTGRQNRRFFRNPMNWYMMDQVVDMPDGMMWPFLMGAFN
ncbi:uncharacterized protein LOC125666776 [Ostrea edulis]|uniref:uncharacterized protein LOC125666776 n=1 Tax=Ostrea edulis TaxID=37623 RepID=UPI0024AEB73A|nr:uncharacterized protein LOC125666776 [Ostrea edulis]